MAVLKLNKSGRSILVIDDDGRTYITSLAHLSRLLNGQFKTDFLVLTRLPNNNSSIRFPSSPVWNPDTGSVCSPEVSSKLGDGSELSTANDALSVKKRADKEIKDVML